MFIDERLVGRVGAGAGGAFAYGVTSAQLLADGTHSVSARAVDRAGNVGPFSVETIFEVRTVAPAPPTITSPANGSFTRDDTPEIRGTALASVTVEVYLDEVLIDSAVSSFAGFWSTTAPLPLAEGQHRITARAIDELSTREPMVSRATGNRITTTVATTPAVSGRPSSHVPIMISSGRPTVSGASA